MADSNKDLADYVSELGTTFGKVWQSIAPATSKKPTTTASGLPTWALPVGLGAAALVIVLVLVRK